MSSQLPDRAPTKVEAAIPSHQNADSSDDVEFSIQTTQASKASGAQDYSPETLILHRSVGQQGTLAWTSSASNVKTPTHASHSPGQHTVVFLETPTASDTAIRESLSSVYGISKDFWDDIFQAANGYFAAHEERDSNDQLVCLNSECRFLCKVNHSESKEPVKESEGIQYVWERMAFYTTWHQDGTSVLLCFDLPPQVRGELLVTLQGAPRNSFAYPFEYHHLIIAAVAKRFEQALWQWRNIVRELEERRPKVEEPEGRKPNYIRMHELSRHTTHCTESLATTMEVSRAIQDKLQELNADRELALSEQIQRSKNIKNQSLPRSWSIRHSRNGFTKQHTFLSMLHNRSKAVEQRLSSEISLVFHISGQQDSNISAQIARSSKEDSQVTRTIAFLGLLFLPGTLISAIFSTSFFNFVPGDGDTPDRWRVSDKFWVFWVVTGVVTILTLLIWNFSQKWWKSLRRHRMVFPLFRAAQADAPRPVTGENIV